MGRLEGLAATDPEVIKARQALFDRYLTNAAEATGKLDEQAAAIWIDEATALQPDNQQMEAARAALETRLVEAEAERMHAVSELTMLDYVPPRYPRGPKRRELEGWVEMQFTVSSLGETRDIEVVDASHEYFFRKEAVAAAEQWQFEPHVYRGVTIEPRAIAQVRFSVED